jgi:hypothetical protein
MACVGCKKPLKRETMCKTCAEKPWHEVDKHIEKYATIYFKRDERLVRHIHEDKYLPLKWYGSDYTDELTEITDADREEAKLEFLTIDDVTFRAAYYQKIQILNSHKWKKDKLRSLNNDRENMTPGTDSIKLRQCRICRQVKQLDLNNFHFRVKMRFSKLYLDEVKNDTRYYRKILGHVCRDCYKKQIEAKRELYRLKVSVSGLLYNEKKEALTFARGLCELKKLKRRLRHESNHTDVYGKQQPHEENFEGRV